MANKPDDKIKVTGLWVNEARNGDRYLSGTLNPIVKILIFPNAFKEDGSSDPDYYMYFAPKEKKDAAVPKQQDLLKPRPVPSIEPIRDDSITDDDIPF